MGVAQASEMRWPHGAYTAARLTVFVVANPAARYVTFPTATLMGRWSSMSRACSRDSVSLSFALTQRSLLPGWLSPS